MQQPVSRTVKCPGLDCPRFLRYSIDETDYGTTKVLGCPRCFAEIGVTIPLPTTPSSTADRNEEKSGFADIFEDISNLFGDNKKNNK